jgi:hypothetical protein
MKNSNDTIGNQIPDLLGCSTVPQPNVPTCAPTNTTACAKFMRYKIYKFPNNGKASQMLATFLGFPNILSNNKILFE